MSSLVVHGHDENVLRYELASRTGGTGISVASTVDYSRASQSWRRWICDTRRRGEHGDADHTVVCHDVLFLAGGGDVVAVRVVRNRVPVRISSLGQKQ